MKKALLIESVLNPLKILAVLAVRRGANGAVDDDLCDVAVEVANRERLRSDGVSVRAGCGRAAAIGSLQRPVAVNRGGRRRSCNAEKNRRAGNKRFAARHVAARLLISSPICSG